MYKKLSQIQNELTDLREKGHTRGYSIGWDWELLPYTVKLGSTTYLAAPPASGKTEWILEAQINLSCRHGLNHVIFTSETGDRAEVYAELCYKYLGKPYINGQGSMTEGEKLTAEMFIDKHFIVIDPIDEDLTIQDFYALVDEIEKEYNTKIHTTLIDPWNELTEKYEPEDLGREDKYLSRILGYARKNARAKNRHHFIVTHVRDQALIEKDGKRFYPMPHAREFAGGQTWFRKGNSMLISWRPPEGLVLDDFTMARENEMHLRVAKSKPKGVSKNGTYKLYLDTIKYQYYMIDPNTGGKIYADRSRTQREGIQLEIDDLPF